jgi:hypothetical protein
MEATVAGHSSIARRPTLPRVRTGSIAFALLLALGVWIGSLAPPDGSLVDIHGDLDGSPVTVVIGVGVSRHYAGYTLDPRGYPRLLASSRPGQRHPTMSSLAGTTIPGGPRYIPRANLATLTSGSG